MKPKKVLITGGTGMIGKALSALLVDKGFQVTVFSRTVSKQKLKNIQYIAWLPEKEIINRETVINSDIIIHLAGASIAAKRWSKKRKDRLLKSRTKGIHLIAKILKNNKNHCKHFISAGGVGYYGFKTSDALLAENTTPGDDFIGKLCVQWEKASDAIEAMGVPTSILRTGVVLDPKDGALKKMLPIFRLGLGSALGTGKQYFPWISLQDIARMYVHLIEGKHEGIYNAVAPEIITNYEFSQKLAQALKKPFFMPAIPAFVLKLCYGELALLLLTGCKISCEKIKNTNFTFLDNLNKITGGI